MRRSFLALLLSAFILASCSNPSVQTSSGTESSSPETSSVASGPNGSESQSEHNGPVTFTDALGRTVEVSSPERVAVCTGSFAEVWSIAGGELYAVTQDAYEQPRLTLDDGVVDLGSNKSPNLEVILENDIDFVVLSANMDGQLDMQQTLEQAGITCAYFEVEMFDDYLNMLKVFTDITGNPESYEKYGSGMQEEINSIIAECQGRGNPTVLLIRAYSSGANARNSNNTTGATLKDLGCINIADSNSEILESLSMEKILEADPDFIFVVTMGSSEQDALDLFKQNFESNPAWSSLTAVKEGRFHVLQKELYHLKPNSQWAESYRILADLLYGEE